MLLSCFVLGLKPIRHNIRIQVAIFGKLYALLSTTPCSLKQLTAEIKKRSSNLRIVQHINAGLVCTLPIGEIKKSRSNFNNTTYEHWKGILWNGGPTHSSDICTITNCRLRVVGGVKTINPLSNRAEHPVTPLSTWGSNSKSNQADWSWNFKILPIAASEKEEEQIESNNKCNYSSTAFSKIWLWQAITPEPNKRGGSPILPSSVYSIHTLQQTLSVYHHSCRLIVINKYFAGDIFTSIRHHEHSASNNQWHVCVCAWL